MFARDRAITSRTERVTRAFRSPSTHFNVRIRSIAAFKNRHEKTVRFCIRVIQPTTTTTTTAIITTTVVDSVYTFNAPGTPNGPTFVGRIRRVAKCRVNREKVSFADY